MESGSLEIPVKGHFFFLKNVLNNYIIFFKNIYKNRELAGYAKQLRSKGFTLNTTPASFNWGST